MAGLGSAENQKRSGVQAGLLPVSFIWFTECNGCESKRWSWLFPWTPELDTLYRKVNEVLDAAFAVNKNTRNYAMKTAMTGEPFFVDTKHRDMALNMMHIEYELKLESGIRPNPFPADVPRGYPCFTRFRFGSCDPLDETSASESLEGYTFGEYEALDCIRNTERGDINAYNVCPFDSELSVMRALATMCHWDTDTPMELLFKGGIYGKVW